MNKVLLCVFALIELGLAQSNGSIKGNVIENGSNFPLTGVNVLIKGSQLGASTDLEGNYHIKDVPVGTYVLSIEYIGYKSFLQADVVVKPNKIAYVNTSLFEDALGAGVVEVTASFFQKDESKPISAISYSTEEIRRAPGSGGEISRVVSVMPSVATAGSSSQDIIVRGGSPLENGYYLDNIPVPAIAHFQMSTGNSNGPMGIIDADLIDNVEFSTGGFNASHGDRLSSVMDISYREGNTENFDGRLDLNLAGYGGSFEGPLSENASFFISGRKSYLDLVMDNIKEEGNAPRFADLQGKLSFRLNDENKLTLLNIYGQSGITNKLSDAIKNELDKSVDFGGYQNTTGINWMYTPSLKFFSNTSVSFTQFGSDVNIRYTGLDSVNEEDKLLVDYANDYTYTHIRNSSYYQASDATKLEFGFDARFQTSEFSYELPEHLDVYQNTVEALNVTKDVETNYFGGFASATQSAGNFSATLGVRADYYAHNENTYLSPRVSATYQYTDKLAFNGSYGLYYQSVSPYIISQDPSNKSLENVKATHQILGFDYLLSENTKLSFELFNKEYENAPELPVGVDPNNMSFVMDNRSGFGSGKYVSNGTAYTRGVELMVQKKLAEDIYGTVSASHFVSKYKDRDGISRNRDFDARTTINLIGGYKPSNEWEFGARWQYQGGLPETPVDEIASAAAGDTKYDMSQYKSDRLPSMHSLFVRIDRRFNYENSSMNLYLSIWNSYGRENVLARAWDPVKKELKDETAMGMLPFIGVEYEF